MSSQRVRTTGVTGILLLLAALIAVLWWVRHPTQAAREARPAPPVSVSVTQVAQRDVPHLARGVGTVQALHHVVLRTQIDGILTETLFAEGQSVEKGQLLARIDDRAVVAALAQARAERARNEAQLKSAQLDLKRYRNLLQDHAVSKQTLDQTTALVQQLRAAIAANEAAIAAAEVQFSYTRIRAPVSGRIGLRRVDPGNLVRTTDAEGLVSVTQIDPIAVLFSLPQDLLPRVHAQLHGGKPVPITALDGEGGAILAQGRLMLVDNQIDPATGTIRLKAELPNAQERLWPGQFVTVELPVGHSPSANVLAAKAVQLGIDGPFVYRVRDGKAETVAVRTGYQTDDFVVIEGGLASGDTVVLDGHSRLKPGAAVHIIGEAGNGHAARERPRP